MDANTPNFETLTRDVDEDSVVLGPWLLPPCRKCNGPAELLNVCGDNFCVYCLKEMESYL